ncbi:MAG: hypothetical protein MRQ13_04540 [Candidatus Midichloria sp.]|nr:hypothetical protein [Candidatus Midichloria sp.]
MLISRMHILRLKHIIGVRWNFVYMHNIQKRNWDNAAQERFVEEEALQKGLQKRSEEGV